MRPLRYSINVTLDGPTLLSGLSDRLELELVERHDFHSGAVALRYQPSQTTG